MAKKETVDKRIKELKTYIDENRVVIGTQETLKGLKSGKFVKVFVASNCAQGVLGDIKTFAKLGATELIEMKQPNDELGVVCRKPFSISVIGILKV